MTQSIKISDDAKEKLLRLQAQLLLEKNHKIPLKDLLDLLLNVALSEPERLYQMMKNGGNQGHESWKKRLHAPIKWGIKDSSTNIDEYIAGR